MIDIAFCVYPFVKSVAQDKESHTIVLREAENFKHLVERAVILDGAGVGFIIYLHTITLTVPDAGKVAALQALNAIASIEAMRKAT